MDIKFKRLDKYIERNKSVINRSNLEHLYTFKDFPLFFGCVDSPEEDDLVADMDWAIDKNTGAIQLSKLIPLEILYQEQHVDGTGPTWKKYYEDFADFIYMQRPKNVLEIGGGSGNLANEVTSKDKKIKWTVIEPNPRIQKTNQIDVIDGFFNKKLLINNKIDTIVISQVLEHIYEPDEFIEELGLFLDLGCRVILAYPQLKVWLEKKYTNAINFEHTFLIDDFIEYLFNGKGFINIQETKYNQHSIFYIFENTKRKLTPIEPPSRYSEYKNIFNQFISYHEKLIKDINLKIEKSQNPTYLFGAHIFATYLFAFGLNKKIEGILDNSKLKQNRRLYGTPFLVSSPEVLKGKGKVNIILKAGLYNEEIKKDILQNINNEVSFW